MKLRLGLIGLGNGWESRHEPALRALADRFEVKAVFDQITHRAELAAARFNAVAVQGFRSLAQREDVDAIVLLGDGWYGILPMLAACDYGKAVYSANATRITLAESMLLRRRVHESGVAFQGELVRRHAPATLRLKELIATRLGSPKLVFSHFRGSERLRGNPRAAGSDQDAYRHELIELLDWCRFVVGSEPRWVTSTAHAASPSSPEPAACLDYQTIFLDFSEGEHSGTGPMAQISCSRYLPTCWSEALGYRPLAAMQVACERGVAFIDLPSTLVWFDEAGRHQESLDSERPVAERLLSRFFHAVTSLVVNTSDLDDTCRAVEILEKADRSHQEGRRIEL
ncbi:MAG: Gfo/Idh/MocA family protein [Thermoguttaceae bacterium]